MSPKLQKIYDFLYEYEQVYLQQHAKRPKGGRCRTYTDSSFILFFIAMFLRRKYAYKTMARIVKTDFAKYGFPKPPARKTIRERFKKLPSFIMYLMPEIAKYCYKKICPNTFNIKCLFSDKSIFRAKGGIWHKKHIDQGIVPHPSIDTQATWAFSPYHKWRFGYALLIMVNQHRFPVVAIADTGALNEPQSVENMIKKICEYVGVIVGDAAYEVYHIINNLYENYGILLQVRASIKDKNMKWYDQLIHTPQALLTYLKRKPSVEPTFALIKELFDLHKDKQLPFKGKKYVIPFLLITALTVQLMAIYNFFNNKGLGYTHEFSALF